jgi:hypothetical protein
VARAQLSSWSTIRKGGQLTEEENVLRTVFLGHQQVLSNELTHLRSSLKHSVTKGDATELKWISMLGKHLPKRYGVKKAQVLDCHGEISEQLDMVIFDCHYTPLILNEDGACYIPAEGVYAVFEIKQDISKEHIEYAGQKIASVRRLARTSAPIIHAGGRYDPKPPPRILGGLLTLGSTWSPPLGESFRSALAGLVTEGALDLGCTLDGGAWYQVKNNDVQDVASLVVSDKNTALVVFFLRLLSQLQQMGTVPAMDFDQYMSVLGLHKGSETCVIATKGGSDE